MIGQLDDVLRGRKFKKVIRERYAGIRKKYDIKQVEVEILMYLHQFPGAPASQLCSELELNKGQVSRALLDLCLKHFICPEKSPVDRRCTVYGFTDKGKRFFREAEREREKTLRLMVSGISQQEMAVTRAVAEKMLANMEKLQG